MSKYNLTKDGVAYIADDVMELLPFQKVGFKIAVSNAVKEVKEVADYITTSEGGHGAVREAIEFILKAQNKWDKLIKNYRGSI
jgi:3-deoxy-D-manno-octulosonate 8-phosphate phosphatase (KDO 8-P phosphatase)